MHTFYSVSMKLILLLAISFTSQYSFSQPGTHLAFDGVNDQVTGTNNSLPTGNAPRTVEVWIKSSQTAGSQTFFIYGTASISNQFGLIAANGSLYIVGFNNDYNTGVPICNGQWHHVAASFDGTTLRAYVDGILAGNPVPKNYNTLTGSYKMGMGLVSNSYEPLNGLVDEVRVWNTALPADVIAQRKNCELNTSEPGLVAYYQFNQGTGGGANTGLTTLTGSAATPGNGTLNNFALSGTTSNWLSGSAVTTGFIVPPAPTANPAQSFPGPATIADLAVTGSNIQWYATPAGGTPLTTSTPALHGSTYYAASLNANGCESIRVPVTVTIPITVNAVSNQTVCTEVVTSPVNFSGSRTGILYSWANNNTSTGLAASGYGNIAGFTASNTGSTPVVSSVTVTPSFGGVMAYVPNLGSDDVSVINTTSKTVVATIPVGDGPIAVAANPSGSMVYIANQLAGTVSVINTNNNIVVATITVGAQPTGMAFSPDGNKLYVCNVASASVSVISTATNTVTATINTIINPYFIAISPDGGTAYVTPYGPGNVYVISTVSNSVVDNFPVGANPTGLVISPDGSTLYVANYNSNDVYVVNTIDNSILTTIPVGANPIGMALNTDGSRLYVSNYADNNVSVITTATYSVDATIATGAGPNGVSVSPDDSRVYVGCIWTGSVSIINTATNTVVGTTTVGTYPYSLGNFVISNPVTTGTTRVFTITVNPFALATANISQTLPVSGTTVFSNGCSDYIATVTATGASPINGNTTARVWIDATQGYQYVKRHYEMTPATNAASATGRITLYFTQQEFNQFNALSPSKLPTGPLDALGKANLLIEKRSGTSNDGSGLPGSYTGSVVTIDPADADIVWNAAASRWEVSFAVAGFSGFFVKTISALLPVNWLGVNGILNAQKQALISWQVQETDVANYTIEKSSDGRNFAAAGHMNSRGNGLNDYQFTDPAPLQGLAYYRLKQTDNNGRYSYSAVIKLNSQQGAGTSIYPNPAGNNIVINVSFELLHTIALLRNINGQLLQSIRLNSQGNAVNISTLPAGVYMLYFANGKTDKIIKE